MFLVYKRNIKIGHGKWCTKICYGPWKNYKTQTSLNRNFTWLQPFCKLGSANLKIFEFFTKNLIIFNPSLNEYVLKEKYIKSRKFSNLALNGLVWPQMASNGLEWFYDFCDVSVDGLGGRRGQLYMTQDDRWFFFVVREPSKTNFLRLWGSSLWRLDN